MFVFIHKLLSIVSNKKDILSFLALNCLTLTPPKWAKTCIHYFCHFLCIGPIKKFKYWFLISMVITYFNGSEKLLHL